MLRSRQDAWLFSKRLIKNCLGRDHLTGNDVMLETARYGTQYGGWVIAPNLLRNRSQIDIVSIGLGEDISFDLEMIRRFGARVFGFDPTTKSADWIKSQTLPSQLRFFEIGVAAHDGEQEFSVPRTNDDFSARRASVEKVRLPVARLQTLFSKCSIESADILKMDVEGSEYAVIEDICAGELRPTQLLIEFHHGIDGISVKESLEAVANLKARNYKVFDISPVGREFSFIHDSALSTALR